MRTVLVLEPRDGYAVNRRSLPDRFLCGLESSEVGTIRRANLQDLCQEVPPSRSADDGETGDWIENLTGDDVHRRRRSAGKMVFSIEGCLSRIDPQRQPDGAPPPGAGYAEVAQLTPVSRSATVVFAAASFSPLLVSAVLFRLLAAARSESAVVRRTSALRDKWRGPAGRSTAPGRSDTAGKHRRRVDRPPSRENALSGR